MSAVGSRTLSNSSHTWKTLARQSSNKNKIAFHHMLANSLADVVAEEAAKRLLPDLNLETQSQVGGTCCGWGANDWRWCMRTFGPREGKLEISTNLTLCLVEEATCTRTVFSTLVDGSPRPFTCTSAMQSLQCVQSLHAIQILEPPPLRATANAAAVISQFKNKKRQLINTSARNSCHVLDQSGERNKSSSKHDEKELYHCTSLGYRDIQSTHRHPEHFLLPVSLEPELDLAHTYHCCDYSLSQTAEQSGDSHHVLTKLHGYGMEGKRRRIAEAQEKERNEQSTEHNARQHHHPG